MIKYRHKETGLFLTKKSQGYTRYSLTKKGTIWNKDCFNTLSKVKDPHEYGFNQYWTREEFEIVNYDLIEKQ